MNLIRLAFAIGLALLSSVIAVGSQKIVPCPGVDIHNGNPIYADGSPRPTPNESPSYLDGDKQVIEALKPKALEVLGRFEGGDALWGAVGSDQQLSLGYIQWNWQGKENTLMNQLFVEVGEADIATALPSIKNGLKKLKEYSDALQNQTATNELQAAAQNVIDSWRTGKEIKANIKVALAKWLRTPGMRGAQKRAMKIYWEDAFWYARAWLRETHSQAGIDERLVTFFFDLRVFQGGLAHIWVPAVTEFLKQYGDDKLKAVDAVTVWLQSCAKSPYQMRGKKVAPKNVKYWRKLMAAATMSDEQVNLLVYALLRAQVANGHNDGSVRGFYQPNILNRRGVITVGGYYSGTDPCWDPFGLKKDCSQ